MGDTRSNTGSGPCEFGKTWRDPSRLIIRECRPNGDKGALAGLREGCLSSLSWDVGGENNHPTGKDGTRTYMNYGKRIVPEVGPRPETGVVVDASCLAVQDSIECHGYFHGVVEWQATDIATHQTIHASATFEQGNINIAEFIAIVDAVFLLHESGDNTTAVYSDSLTAIAWVRNRKVRSKHPRNDQTRTIMGMMDTCLEWLIATKPTNPVRFWDNVIWGENPADYGRK